MKDIASGDRVYFYCYVPEHLQRALWDYAEDMDLDPRKLRRETIARYVERLMKGELMSDDITHPLGFSEKIVNPLGLQRNVDLVPLLLDLPTTVALQLANVCEETGVAKGAVITLAIDQFLRANRIDARDKDSSR